MFTTLVAGLLAVGVLSNIAAGPQKKGYVYGTSPTQTAMMNKMLYNPERQ